MATNQKQIQHLYWRAGFGINPMELKKARGKSHEQLVDEIFKSSKKFEPIEMDLSSLKVQEKKKLSREERQKLNKLRNQKMFEMNLIWLQRMAETEAMLREKMAFFFHDHFAVRIKSPVANIHLINTIRKHALGSFGDLLMEVSKSPAMISFLNNKQNKKDHPNENFAREVMELFTLGRDNGYTETDIKEAARAFTGWSFDKEGKFIFRQRVHDFGSKTILGQTGNFKGEDVIRILLEQRQTAKYLTEKIVDFIIGRPVSASTVGSFTDTFYSSNYDLSALVKAILLHPDFWADESIGCKIKSPTELLAGMIRLFEIEFREPQTLIQLQRKLNQLLFFPPNVAGWPGGKSWIDSSTLMLRLKTSSMLLNFGVIEWDEKGDMPETALIRTEKRREAIRKKTEKRVQAYPNWDAYEKKVKALDSDLADFLVQPSLSAGARTTLENSDSTSIKDRSIEILSLPEYQLF